ncbi:hypothetical protein GCM10011610_42210 [Nocardia rhizosphaerihabitans]|uniref:Uncharacterized protein n=1 Tax=Nocardia rhizosphaerihabitans TaxID=1691570 RepID=A0ABQ2KM70_9NOCA|nr:hypothetical protein GCM10011610_42210 [Nocardia rhizosphaerihabitans]
MVDLSKPEPGKLRAHAWKNPVTQYVLVAGCHGLEIAERLYLNHLDALAEAFVPLPPIYGRCGTTPRLREMGKNAFRDYRISTP